MSGAAMVLAAAFAVLSCCTPLSQITMVDAFANNLVETNIGCMTDLSTEEVIMNNEVRPPEESDFPKMHLVVLDSKDRHLESPYSYDASSATTTIRIAFLIPYPTSEFNDDLQFVAEVERIGAGDEETQAPPPAEFVAGGSIGCEHHRRLSARHMDDDGVVVLRINDPTARLRVWAGWATGHSAVRLVPDLVLEPGEASASTEGDREEQIAQLEEAVEEIEEDIEGMEEELKEEEFRNSGQEKLLRDQEKEKLEKLLGDPGGDGNKHNDEHEADNDAGAKPKKAAEATTDTATTKKQRSKLKRKRKNMLEKPGNVPDGLLESDKGGKKKDLGLEILPASGSNADQNANGDAKPKTMPQKLKEQTLNLVPSEQTDETTKGKHRLTDHTNRGRRDQHPAVDYGIDDGGIDDDLPEMLPDSVNDDELPDEGDTGDDDVVVVPETHPTPGSRVAGERGHHDVKQHLLACAFFAASTGLILVVFGKKRDKGRRDL